MRLNRTKNPTVSQSVNTAIMNRLSLLTDEEWHIKIERDRNTEAAIETWDKVCKYRDYVKGKQPQRLSEEMREILGNPDETEFSDNICNTIVAEARDRVKFLGWHCKGDQKVDDWLSNFFKLSRMRRMSSEIQYETFRDGNFLVHLAFDNNSKQVNLIQELWYNGSVGAFANYDRAGNIEYVVKDWCEDAEAGIYRRNIYYPGRILRFESKSGMPSSGNYSDWVRKRLPDPNANPDDPDALEKWPVEWIRSDGTPLPVPYVHFCNTGWGLCTRYGNSELTGGIIGYQDQLNDMSWDQQIFSRLNGNPIYTASGVDSDSDLHVGMGQIWKAESPESKFSTLAPGNPDGLIKIYNLKGRRVAQISRTPAHIIIGSEWPSGEAIMRAEVPAIGKANSQIDGMADMYVLLAHRAIEIYNTFSNKPKLSEDIEKAMITVRFGPTDRRDDLSQSTVASNLGERISDEEVMRRMGYEDNEIEQIEEEKTKAADEAFKRAQKVASLTANNSNNGQNQNNSGNNGNPKNNEQNPQGGGNNKPVKTQNDRGPLGGKPNGGRNPQAK